MSHGTQASRRTSNDRMTSWKSSATSFEIEAYRVSQRQFSVSPARGRETAEYLTPGLHKFRAADQSGRKHIAKDALLGAVCFRLGPVDAFEDR